MFTKSFPIVFAAAVAFSVSALSVNTPAELTQCGTIEIKWSGKNVPFIFSVLPSCESNSEDPLMEFTGINGTSYKWTVNLPASTGAIAFAITDNKGNEAYTDEVVIKKSDDVSCLSAASTGVASTSGAAPTTSTAVTNAPFSSGADSLTRTTLSLDSTPVPSAPVNVGAGLNSGASSGSEGSSASSESTQVNSATTHIAPAFAGVMGIATALLVF
ncbi:hypothetical protein RSOLAG1IB_01747 [Rhizoctonia solani AG-1 IB]|uniref:Uncharacterized protein n=1 Tax=Thanatephorus cucumeris (strain AG1-IB / isolate 7/3/14) TaxID=1108050 RepID=M5BX44_THACB|nr:hypothetical protein BN14_05780 [Rhizoctonia solani AG-1 IB]CEL55735.1 hypothetical protein RSOLAG1IB_01747 [Rhizoctonia solani AG-1 IB]